MKKLKVIGLGLISCLILSGCGGKTLKCTYEDEESGVKMTGDLTATIKDDKVVKVKFIVSTQATSDLMKSYWSMLTPSIDEVNEKNLKLTSKNDEKNYKYTITLEAKDDKVYESMKSQESSLGEAFSGGKTYDEIKSAIESYGYKCK